MTWAKLDDGTDEELEYLGHAAHRLFIDSITMSRRRNLGGRLAPSQLGPMMRRLHIPPRAITELLAAGPDDTDALWLHEGDAYVIRNYEKFNPLTSTERVKKHRRTKRGETLHGTPPPVPGTPLARASATGLETNNVVGVYPVPVPLPDGNADGTGVKTPTKRRFEIPQRGFKGGEMTSLAEHLPKLGVVT